MMDENLPKLPTTLGHLVETLAGLSNRFEEQLERAIASAMKSTDWEDHLVIATLRRAIDNIQGLLLMADQKNLFCGMPIVRFQIDTAMTLFGRRLVADVEGYVTHMLSGKERRKYKDKDDEQMNDGYLHKKVTALYEHTSDLYAYASGYVHFSDQHLYRVLDLDLSKQTGQVAFRRHDDIVAGWTDEERKGAILQFIYASTIIMDECEIWEKKRWPDGTTSEPTLSRWLT
jgi:hypothetical protein